MSASPIFSSAAMGRSFIFSPRSSPRSNAASIAEKTAKKTTAILAHVGGTSKLAAVLPASRLDVPSAPEMVSSGIPQLDSLTGGLARGCLTEICGTASSGRTSVLLFALARATQRGEVCALVDASDAFDPASAAAAGMEMSRLLWVRCGEKYPSRKNPSSARQAGCAEPDTYQKMPASDSYQGMPSGIPQGFWEGHDFRACPERSRMGAVSPAQSSPALAAEDSCALQRRKFSSWKNPESQRW